ncbi:MAG: 3'-5' exonuclease [Firmicutes bacterium]|nr:3'-5' exonuclease [Bacillota bacterium]
MDQFLDYLIRKSEKENNEFFNYRQNTDSIPASLRRPRERQAEPAEYERPKYTKITEPTASSYVVMDFETTGMNCNINRIIEIGAVKVVDGRINGTFSTLIDTEQYIPGTIVQKVHITNQMVKGKPHIEDVLPDFVDFIGELPLVAHNASFDMSFLLASAQRAGISISNPAIDTVSLSRRYNKECARHNLAYLTQFFGIELKNAHRAYFDAAATQKLYEIIRKKFLSLDNAEDL